MRSVSPRGSGGVLVELGVTAQERVGAPHPLPRDLMTLRRIQLQTSNCIITCLPDSETFTLSLSSLNITVSMGLTPHGLRTYG